MHVLIGDRKVNLTEGAGGRLQATFTAAEDTHSVLIPSDCIGTLNVNDIQLEQGSQATSFVEPAVHAEDISGIFKDLRDIRIDIKDTEEGLSHQITINQEGLEQLISDTEERLNSRITLTADTWQGELSDTEQELSNQITATAGLWQTKLSDTERGLQSAIQSKADSLITLIEDTDSKNFSKTEQLVNGLKTTVQGDLRSQRTQLENLISSSIENATGSRSTIWQTLNSHGSQISNAQGAINRVEQTVSGYSRRVSDVEGKYSSIEQTVSGLNFEVNGYNGGVQSRFRQLEGLIDARVTRRDVEGIIQNSGDNIWLAIGNRVKSVADNATMSGYEIMSEINLQANRQIFRVSDNRLMITEDTTYIDNSVIKSAHIASLSADKITAGTLDAAKVRVINLNAQNISGFNSAFVQSLWNGINNSVRIDSSGVWSNASDQSQVFMMDGRLNVRNPNGATIGSVGYWYSGGSPRFTIRTTLGAHFSLLQRDSRGRDFETIYAGNGGAEYYNRADRVYFEGSRADIRGDLYILNAKTLRLSDGNITDAYGIYFNYGGGMWTLSGGEATRVNGVKQLQLQVNNTKKITIDTTRIYMYQDLNMQYHSIVQQSDARFKTNVQDYDYDALSRVDQIKFKTFNWKSSGKRDYGFIAQEVQEFAPEWINEEPDGSLTYDTLLIAKIALRSAQQLSQKIKELENEIKTLSGNEP